MLPERVNWMKRWTFVFSAASGLCTAKILDCSVLSRMLLGPMLNNNPALCSVLPSRTWIMSTTTWMANFLSSKMGVLSRRCPRASVRLMTAVSETACTTFAKQQRCRSSFIILCCMREAAWRLSCWLPRALFTLWRRILSVMISLRTFELYLTVYGVQLWETLMLTRLCAILPWSAMLFCAGLVSP